MIQVTMPDAQARLPELLAVAERGEEVEIRTEAGRSFRLTVQALVPSNGVSDSAWPGFPAAGSCKGMIWMADDFDAPLEELREYME
jgi:antitoxin (DNA-binding transcriptional repressor) of toxin-antitoxin stability system